MATVLGWRGRVGQIGTRGVSALIQGGRRWVVERSHAWLNAFGQLGWCTERRGACVAFWPALAWVVAIIRRLVRCAWTYRALGVGLRVPAGDFDLGEAAGWATVPS